MEERLNKTLKELFDKTIQTATDGEVFEALMIETNKEMEGRPRNKGEKKVYYISAEFLIGKLLSNNLINLGLFSEVKAALQKNGKSIEAIEEYEYEPSLGNGGLGRLAACFLDSIASLGNRSELSYGTVRTKIHGSETACREKSVDHAAVLAEQTGDFVCRAFPPSYRPFYAVRYRCTGIWEGGRQPPAFVRSRLGGRRIGRG